MLYCISTALSIDSTFPENLTEMENRIRNLRTSSFFRSHPAELQNTEYNRTEQQQNKTTEQNNRIQS